jgi:2-polyprenyl-3-methyl-5-hydroxy-6-metoxy-1,4-benzoquinol methylase
LGNHSFSLKNRFPEPELMSDQSQVDAYAKADFSSAHSDLILNLKNRIPRGFQPKRILDLGSGPGDMAFRLAELFPNSNFTFIDGSMPMIAACREYFESKYSGMERFSFLCERIQNFVPIQPYDLVFSNSLLHHVDDPFEFWACIQRSMDENTFVFVSDLLRPISSATAEAIVERYANGEPQILKEDFFNSLLAAYTKEEVDEHLTRTRLQSKLICEQTSDRHWVCFSKPSRM